MQFNIEETLEMDKKPLTIPKIIVLYILPFFIPIGFLIVPIYTFMRFNRKWTGWFFVGAEVVIFILLAILFNPAKANPGDFLYDYAILILAGPVVLIHLIAFYLTISLSKSKIVQN